MREGKERQREREREDGHGRESMNNQRTQIDYDQSEATETDIDQSEATETDLDQSEATHVDKIAFRYQYVVNVHTNDLHVCPVNVKNLPGIFRHLKHPYP